MYTASRMPTLKVSISLTNAYRLSAQQAIKYTSKDAAIGRQKKMLTRKVSISPTNTYRLPGQQAIKYKPKDAAIREAEKAAIGLEMQKLI